ncbi:MAG: hypothetical protein WA865_03020 [Spirulinaceae cyanobacterium]
MYKRTTGLTEKQKAFLVIYCDSGSITKASQTVGIHRNTGSRWLKMPKMRRAVADYLAIRELKSA